MNASPETIHPEEGEASEDHFPWEAILAYIPVFCLYPWSVRQRMPGLEVHARQGMMLFAVELVLLLVLIRLIRMLLWLGVIVLAVLGIIAAVRGKPYRLPVLADLADRLAGEKPGREVE